MLSERKKTHFSRFIEVVGNKFFFLHHKSPFRSFLFLRLYFSGRKPLFKNKKIEKKEKDINFIPIFPQFRSKGRAQPTRHCSEV